jgi:ribosomal protein S18 acetylase RimI-like enzyme
VPALAVAPIADADIPAVIALWQACGLTRPWNDPASDIALARRGPHSTILIGRDGGAIVATVMVGHDGHRGWVYYVATDPDRRGKGFGRAIMNAAEDWLRAAGILKLQLLVRRENDKAGAFYQSIGYEEAQTIVFAKWLDGRTAT